MKVSIRIAALVAVTLGLSLGSALAVPSTYELGSVDPGSPASPSDETGYLTTLVGDYNLGDTGSTTVSGYTYTLAPGSYVPAAPLPGVGTELVNQQQPSSGAGNSGSITVAVDTGADYALIKWGDTSELYYIGGLTGNVTLDNDVNDNGESHYDEWAGSAASVSDGGTTAILLGGAMLVLLAAAPRFRRASA